MLFKATGIKALLVALIVLAFIIAILVVFVHLILVLLPIILILILLAFLFRRLHKAQRKAPTEPAKAPHKVLDAKYHKNSGKCPPHHKWWGLTGHFLNPKFLGCKKAMLSAQKTTVFLCQKCRPKGRGFKPSDIFVHKVKNK